MVFGECGMCYNGHELRHSRIVRSGNRTRNGGDHGGGDGRGQCGGIPAGTVFLLPRADGEHRHGDGLCRGGAGGGIDCDRCGAAPHPCGRPGIRTDLRADRPACDREKRLPPRRNDAPAAKASARLFRCVRCMDYAVQHFCQAFLRLSS